MIDKNFARIHKAPTGSYVKMTPNVFMTNEVWLDIAPSLCKGIRSMKGICDHPTWWVVLSYDGYGSHCHRPSRYVPYKSTFVPYDVTYGAPN